MSSSSSGHGNAQPVASVSVAPSSSPAGCHEGASSSSTPASSSSSSSSAGTLLEIFNEERVRDRDLMSMCSDHVEDLPTSSSDTEPPASGPQPKPVPSTGSARARREKKKRMMSAPAAVKKKEKAYTPRAVAQPTPNQAARRRRINRRVVEACRQIGIPAPSDALPLPSLPAQVHPGFNPEEAKPSALAQSPLLQEIMKK